MHGRRSSYWVSGICAAAVAAAPLGGMAQPASAPVVPGQDVTTLESLTVNAFAQVGEGATYFQPTELQLEAHQARMDAMDSKQAAQQCQQIGKRQHREDLGDFDLEALWNTEYNAQQDVWRTGEAARVATEAALNARADLVAGKITQAQFEAAEIARQTTVKAFQDAQVKAREAHFRVNDLQQMAMEYVSGNLAAVQDLEAHKYVDGCQPTGNGTIEVSESTTMGRCQRVDFVGEPRGEGMEQFRGEIEQRTAERARGVGSSIYVPKEFQDLRITAVSAHEGEEKGVSFLRVVGTIVNSRKNAITVPPLWVAALDRYGTEVKAQQLEPPRGTPKIPSGGSIPFIYVFKPMPERTAKATVTFAPLHRSSGPLTPDAFCPTVFDEVQ